MITMIIRRILWLHDQPFQQFSYSVGKNSTDSAMIIDAMDILHTNLVDGFCLVSSDSDYT
ncbi:MAG TPA: NYN domain-containing protein, partial [Armatimonadota bacterium]|nr:NYN domain-containing protein [Armatimonadota bacterium]